jgi:hypothetical protein
MGSAPIASRAACCSLPCLGGNPGGGPAMSPDTGVRYLASPLAAVCCILSTFAAICCTLAEDTAGCCNPTLPCHRGTCWLRQPLKISAALRGYRSKPSSAALCGHMTSSWAPAAKCCRLASTGAATPLAALALVQTSAALRGCLSNSPIAALCGSLASSNGPAAECCKPTSTGAAKLLAALAASSCASYPLWAAYCSCPALPCPKGTCWLRQPV